MGIRTLYDRVYGSACLYCSTSGWAFGPVFGEYKGRTGQERAQAFTDWYNERNLGKDLRTLSDVQLEDVYAAWRQVEGD